MVGNINDSTRIESNRLLPALLVLKKKKTKTKHYEDRDKMRKLNWCSTLCISPPTTLRDGTRKQCRVWSSPSGGWILYIGHGLYKGNRWWRPLFAYSSGFKVHFSIFALISIGGSYMGALRLNEGPCIVSILFGCCFTDIGVSLSLEFGVLAHLRTTICHNRRQNKTTILSSCLRWLECYSSVLPYVPPCRVPSFVRTKSTLLLSLVDNHCPNKIT